MKFDFRDKTILITGGACGIGAGISDMYLKNGGSVILTYNKSLKEAEDFLNYYGDRLKIFQLDLNDIHSVYKFLNYLKDNFINKIDILINNSGICDVNPLIFQDDDKIFSIINVNFSNTIILTKYILRDFMENEGCIINISSIWGRVGASCESVYASTKGGINLFTKSLSMEMRDRNIKVLGISPGIINTKMNFNLSENEMKEILKEIPLNRIGNVYDVVNAVKFFSSNNVSITGEIINIDGGWFM